MFLTWQLYCLVLFIIPHMFILFMELYFFLEIEKISYLSFTCLFSFLSIVHCTHSPQYAIDLCLSARGFDSNATLSILCIPIMYKIIGRIYSSLGGWNYYFKITCRIGFHSFMNLFASFWIMGNILDIDRKVHHVTCEKKSYGWRAWRMISLSNSKNSLPCPVDCLFWELVTPSISGAL